MFSRQIIKALAPAAARSEASSLRTLSTNARNISSSISGTVVPPSSSCEVLKDIWPELLVVVAIGYAAYTNLNKEPGHIVEELEKDFNAQGQRVSDRGTQIVKLTQQVQRHDKEISGNSSMLADLKQKIESQEAAEPQVRISSPRL